MGACGGAAVCGAHTPEKLVRIVLLVAAKGRYQPPYGVQQRPGRHDDPSAGPQDAHECIQLVAQHCCIAEAGWRRRALRGR